MAKTSIDDMRHNIKGLLAALRSGAMRSRILDAIRTEIRNAGGTLIGDVEISDTGICTFTMETAEGQIPIEVSANNTGGFEPQMAAQAADEGGEWPGHGGHANRQFE
jgi:hypothetical protein